MTKRVFGSYAWKNGEFVSFSNLALHPCTHSLHYSGLIFEGIACYSGNIFKLKEHVKRFFNSANLMGLRLAFKESELALAIEQLATMNSCNPGRFYIRPAAWYGAQQIAIKRNTNEYAQVCIFTCEMQPLDSNDRANLVLSSWTKASGNSMPHQCKSSGNYSSSILAKAEATRFGGSEALLLDFAGRIAECGSANIFFVQQDSTLITPKTDCCLEGITRKTILELAENLGISSQEKDILLSDLAACSDAFITGTGVGVLPVSSLLCPKDGMRLEFKTGPIAKLLYESYVKLVHSRSNI
jgi:branched-chain amino acid aminotransferase